MVVVGENAERLAESEWTSHAAAVWDRFSQTENLEAIDESVCAEVGGWWT